MSARPIRRPYLLVLILVGMGALSVVLMVLARRSQEAAVKGDLAAQQAVAEIEAQTAIVHLWLEEYVSGDEAIALDEIGQRLTRARTLADLLTGRRAPAADLGETAALAAHLQALAESLSVSLSAFAEISNDRVLGVNRRLEVGIGSDFDIETDRLFRRLLDDAGRLQEALRHERRAHSERDALTFQILLGGWLLIIALTSWVLFEHERRRARAEAALQASEARLRRAQKLDAVGRLAGGLAHDIKNYLAAIRSQADLLARKSTDDKVLQKMGLITSTVDRAAGLIDRLLAFSRRQPAVRLELDVGQLAQSLVPVFEPTLPTDVHLVVDLEPGLWPVSADPAQLEQVIMNLLVNAQEALGTSGTVRLRARNRAPDRVVLAVEDDGPGIPPDDLDKVFEPFFTTKKDLGGGHEHSGLGLATAYGIVEDHGGSLEVASELGRGTSFEIVLPRHVPFMKAHLESTSPGAAP